MDTKRLCPSCQKPLAPNVPLGLCPECLIQAGFPTGVETEAGSGPQPGFAPPTVEEIAKLFPQLEILELIGKGGMGAVYKARQKQLNRFVALKILPPGIGSEPAFAGRFTREAQALAQLNHPGIVTLYEFGETSGQFYFLMEFVDGVNLRQLMRTSRVSPREALAIVPQICDALQFAHDQGIVHRDIKPENILLDRRGRVKVADFGLAKIVGAAGREGSPLPAGVSQAGGGAHGVTRPTSDLTDAGKVMGTPQYMSPEQIAAPGEVDHRADIYALGVVFYQMLTGELPGKTIAPPSSKVQLDVRLDEVVLRALEKNPELRYQQVSEVKTMVETIVATGGAGVPPAEASTREPALLKISSCYYSTPEHLRSFIGRFVYLYCGKGELRLDEDKLTFNREGFLIVIPLRSIQTLRVGRYSRFAKPAGLDHLFVEYQADGRIQQILLTPALSPFATTWATNDRVADWLIAIRQAVAKAGGFTPGSAPGHPIKSSFTGTAIAAVVLLAIFGAVTALFIVKNHHVTPAVILSESVFLDKFQSNEIAHATINFGGGNSSLTSVTGTYFKTDKDGKVTKEEVPFAAPKTYFTAKMLDELLRSDKITISKPRVMWMNLVWSVAPFLFLGVVFLLIPGIIIYLIWRVVNRPRNDAAMRPVAAPASASDQSPREAARTKSGKFAWLSSPLSSPEAREISAHMTKEERSEAILYGMLWGLWVVTVTFGNIWLIRSFPAPGSWIVASVIVLLFFASLPPWFRMQRRFLASTTWAKEQGYSGQKVKLFSFSRQNFWWVLIFVSVACLLAFGQGKLFMRLSGVSELGDNLKADAARTKTQFARLAAQKENAQHAAQNLSFSPVMERTLSADSNSKPPFLCLRDGTLAYAPAQLNHASAPVLEGWWRATNADLLITVKGNKLTMASLQVGGAKFAQVPADKWEGATLNEVADALQNGSVHQPVATGLDEFILQPFSPPATFAVESRSGDTGLLQITGFAKNLSGVKIRYKLVQNGLANPAANPNTAVAGVNYVAVSNMDYAQYVIPTGAVVANVDYVAASNTAVASGTPPLSYQWYRNSNAAAATNISFGPVIEQTMTFDKRGLTDSLDLDSGKIISPLPVGTTVTASSTTLPGFPPKKMPGGISFSRDEKKLLATGDTDVNAVARESWDGMSPDQARAEVGQFQFTPDENVFMSDTVQPAELPKTFVFKTRPGGIGLLQVIGFSDRPPGVKIRYKRVQ